MYRPNVRKHPLDWHEEAMVEEPDLLPGQAFVEAMVIALVPGLIFWSFVVWWVFW